MKKYIITWLIVTTVDVNHSNLNYLALRTYREPQRMEFSNRDAAFIFYTIQQRAYENQFDSLPVFGGKIKTIPCPQCWNYIDSVKIDSTQQ